MSIYPDRKNGVLTGRFAVEAQRGKKRLRGRSNTLAEAKELEAELFARLESGDTSARPKLSPVEIYARDHQPMTFSQAITKAKGRLWHGKAAEEGNYQKLASILEIIGDMPLDSIATPHVDDMIEELQGRGRADATINRYLSSLRRFLVWSMEREYRTTKLPKFEWKDEDEGRIRWLSHDEERDMIDAAPEDVAKVIGVAIETGMRRSEILMLEEKQVAAEWVHLWKTKNAEPRSVPIGPQRREDLLSLIRDGMPTKARLRHEWDKARASIGLKGDKDFVFHACRHTRATRYVQANINLRVIQKLMGHKRIETTLRYAHVNDSMLSDAFKLAQAFDAAISAPGVLSGSARSVGREGAGSPLIFDIIDREEGYGNPKIKRPAADAGVAKLVDAPDLGSPRRDRVRPSLRSRARQS